MSVSGGDQYIHNQGENSKRQFVLQECFRDTSADALCKSGIAKAASFADDYRILEIGCGAGLTTVDLARQLEKGTVTAIDTNPALIADARERLKQDENKDVQARIEFITQNGESISDKWEGNFDAIWMRFVIVHVPDPIRLVQAATRCLKQNGILLIEDCNMEGFVSSPPLYACTLLHEAHIQVSLKLGADVRRGPMIGEFMKRVGLKNVQCNVFAPIFGKGVAVQPWCETKSEQSENIRDPHFELGLLLLRMSLDSLTPKILDMDICTNDDLERARQSVDEIAAKDYQVFSIPGGQVYQWWAKKVSSESDGTQLELAEADTKKRTPIAHKVLEDIVDVERHPIDCDDFRIKCKNTLDQEGALVMYGFLKESTIDSVRREGTENQHLAYYTSSGHNVYLQPPDKNYSSDHPRNREVCSSKGCIQTDQIPKDSALHTLYKSSRFRDFLCAVLGEKELHEYADPLSSINLHYASEGQELNWHYDNSSFAITLLIQKPERGGVFEFVRDVRNADAGDMNYDLSGDILEGRVPTETLEMYPGTLVLFRGRNSMHRVTPVEGKRTRMLVVLAYNTEPDIALSESARMTFFGRLS